ncbi:hypothetical protein GCM10023223_02930 [Stackebrandtia albiflava]
MLQHEIRHRDGQWRVHGTDFGRMYLMEELKPGSFNKYEYDATVNGGDGGYEYPSPSPSPGGSPTPRP